MLEPESTNKCHYAQNYRYWLLYLCPSIRFLDFQKVKDSERAHATSLFGTLVSPSDLAKKVAAQKSRTNFDMSSTSDSSAAFTNGNAGGRNEKIRLTGEEKKKVEELIRNAKSLKEIERLEKMISEGRAPGVGGADVDMGGV